jgi:hypothetical protein
MNFKLAYETHMVLPDVDLSFVYADGSSERVEVNIRGGAVGGVACSATGCRVPPPEAMLVLNSLEQRRVPPGSPDQLAWRGSVDDAGLILENIRFPLEFLPEHFQRFWRTTRCGLADYLDRTRRVLEWRTGTAGSHRAHDGAGIMEWSRDGLSWQTFESPIRSTLEDIRSIHP